jgi:diaminohydroxyphosphoribosylaminopyrimidine deaminase/5-amino-6-(5-phosphoribosylamino)uracil reductase
MSTFTPRNDLIERTLELAQKGWGTTHPNPMVGALIVEHGMVVAEGWHQQAGGPHAEVAALQDLGRKPKEGAEMYVSLEPCSSTGRTPPCTSAILNAGIKKVVVGAIDPDSRHAGHGLDLLREHGVEVVLAPPELGERAARLNFIFNQYVITGRPLIALKLATSANGMVAERAGYPSRVTGDAARADVMHWRRLFPAICVGSGTVIADDPALTARLPEGDWCPVRLVVDSSLDSLSQSFHPRRVYTDQYKDRTIVLTTARGLANSGCINCAQELGVRVVELASGEDGRVSPAAMRQALVNLELCGMYCEGGPALARSLLGAEEIDYVFHYQSNKTFSSPEALHGPDLKNLNIGHAIKQVFGEDQLTHGFL